MTRIATELSTVHKLHLLVCNETTNSNNKLILVHKTTKKNSQTVDVIDHTLKECQKTRLLNCKTLLSR